MLDEIKIMQFADGTLDPSEKEEVKKQIDNNPEYKKILEDYIYTGELLNNLGNEIKSVPLPKYLDNKIIQFNKSTSKISHPTVLDSTDSCPVCERICAIAPEVSPFNKRPSLISLDRIACGVDDTILPVKSVLNPNVSIKNLGRLTTTLGNDVNPDPLFVTVIPKIDPDTTSAVPKAPVPPPPTILTETKP